MPRKLKVFRTSTGFDDAYVAAPSRKAALEAWGADADLFARGVAEQVTDPKLTKEPLAHPGEIVRLPRGDLSTHLKALPKKHGAKDTPKPARAAKATPPPRRDGVDAAEASLKAARQRHGKETKTLEHERNAIERRLDTLRARQGREIASLERKHDTARDAYRAALEKWSG